MEHNVQVVTTVSMLRSSRGSGSSAECERYSTLMDSAAALLRAMLWSSSDGSTPKTQRTSEE